MKKLTYQEIKKMWLDFCVKRGHAIIDSASVVPQNDASVLFINSGMHPLVPYLMGENHPQGKRICNIQKCIRTGDIDEVGDDTHLTFFEMMGSIGFEQIRVSSLAKKAGINRGTFYHHFVDKYEILEEAEREIYAQFELLMKNKHDYIQLNLEELKENPTGDAIQQLFQSSLLRFMMFLYERKEITTILVGENGRPQFVRKIESLYCETVRDDIGAKNQNENYQTHYIQEFVFSGVISVIKCWLRNGAKEAPEEIARLLAINLTTAPIAIFDYDSF